MTNLRSQRKSLPTKELNLWFVSPRVETWMLHSPFIPYADKHLNHWTEQVALSVCYIPLLSLLEVLTGQLLMPVFIWIWKSNSHCLVNALYLLMDRNKVSTLIWINLLLTFETIDHKYVLSGLQTLLGLKSLMFSGRAQHKAAHYHNPPLVHEFPSCSVPRWSHGGDRITTGTSLPSICCR